MKLKEGEKGLDARGVLAEIVAYRNEFNQTSKNKRSSFARNVSIGIWLLGALVVLLSYFVGTKEIVIPDEYVLIYVIAVLISLITMVVSAYRDYSQDDEFKFFFKDPVLAILKTSDRALAFEIGFYAKLDEYSIDALTQARNYLSRKKTHLESISNMLVGVLSKVGLLPALLAVAIVSLRMYSEVGVSHILILPFVLTGLYIFCFRLIEASAKFDEYQSIISDYIEIRNKT